MDIHSRFEVRCFEQYILSVRSVHTAGLYGHSVRQFLSWLGESGAMNLGTAPDDALARYCAHQMRRLKPATVRVQLAGIRRYLTWCRRGGLKIPGFHEPEIPYVSPKMRDALTQPMIVRYFEVTGALEEPLRTAARLLPCCGLRSSEMVGLPVNCLRMTDLTLENGRRKQVMTLRVLGKGNKERLVPLLDEGQRILTKYLGEGGWRQGSDDEIWLFPTSRGHLANRTLRAALQRVREPFGMKFTPHTMRRTYLTELYRRGVEPVLLAKIAGHASIDTLIKHYLAVDEYDVARAVHNAGGQLLAG